jgi:hypothetical protein
MPVATHLKSVRATARYLILTSTLAVASAVQAQSAQPYSIQLAAFFTAIKGGSETINGVGFEPQFRFNHIYASEGFGALSLGIGGQYTTHTQGSDKLTISGGFLEPRWVPAIRSSVIAPYLSLRLAVLHLKGEFANAEDGSSGGTGFGAGAGIAAKLSRTVNLDAGVQLVRQEFGEIGSLSFKPFTTYAAKIGLSVGFPN